MMLLLVKAAMFAWAGYKGYCLGRWHEQRLQAQADRGRVWRPRRTYLNHGAE